MDLRQVSYERLLRLAHQRAIDGKGGLAASIAKMCLDHRADLSTKEIELTFEILRMLIDKVEVQIRRNIADYLAQRDDVPRDLLDFLVNDAVNVAYPILLHSKLLSEDDLIRIIDNNGQGHRLAIANRAGLSKKVSARLVGTWDQEVVKTLLKNHTPAISRTDMETIVERSRTYTDLQEPLVHRPDLPADLARKLYLWVGEALRHHIAMHYDVDPTLVNEASDHAVTQALAEETRERGTPENNSWNDVDDTGLKRANRVMRALDEHGIKAFVQQIIKETELGEAHIRKIFGGQDIGSMAILCKAIGLDTDRFTTVLSIFKGGSKEISFYKDGALVQACTYFDNLEFDDANRVLETWKSAANARAS